jgi:transcriptional regulator with XRE-family HTH domain
LSFVHITMVTAFTLKELRELFGANLLRIREERGLTHQQLASTTGLTVGYISAVEKGKIDIRIENIYALSVGLGIDQHEMLNFKI